MLNLIATWPIRGISPNDTNVDNLRWKRAEIRVLLSGRQKTRHIQDVLDKVHMGSVGISTLYGWGCF